MPGFIDITGQTFGSFTAEKYVGGSGKKWYCKCSCGNIRLMTGTQLRSGQRRSCRECSPTYKSKVQIPNEADLNPLDVAWLAGLLEGDGCFIVTEQNYPKIALSMSDLDTVTRAAAIMQTSVHQKLTTSGLGYKPMYDTYFSGRPAVAWMKILYKQMSIRRKAQIDFCFLIDEARNKK